MSTDSLKIVTPRGKLIALSACCALFAALGVVVLAVSPETPLNVIVGVGAIGFFGIGGSVSLVSLWRRSVVVAVDAEGIAFARKVRVTWSGIERVGVSDSGLGIRLKNPDTLVAQDPRGYPRDELRLTRRTSGGFDIVFEKNQLDRSASDAAAAINARRP